MSIPREIRERICDFVKTHRFEYPEIVVHIIKRTKEYEDKAKTILQNNQEHQKRRREKLENVNFDMTIVTTSQELFEEKKRINEKMQELIKEFLSKEC